MVTPQPVDLNDPIDRDHVVRIGLAWRELRRGASAAIIREQIFGTGPDAIEPGQMDTLDLLSQNEMWRMGDLADALRVDPSTATRAIQRLIKDGFAERVNHGDDGRVVHVRITERGQAVHAQVAERRLAVISHIASQMTAIEREALANLFETFTNALDKVVDSSLANRK